MAAIAPSDIAAGSGAFHKPHGKGAGKADASSSFQQMLDTVDTGQAQNDQETTDASKAGASKADAGKTDASSKTASNDFTLALNSGQSIAATNDNDPAQIAAIVQNGGKSDAGKSDAGAGDTSTGKPGDASNTDQPLASPSSQTAPDPSQILAAAQTPSQTDSGTATAPDPSAATADAQAQTDATPSSPTDQPAAGNSVSNTAQPDASPVSQPAKARDASKDVLAQALTYALPPQSDTPASANSASTDSTGKPIAAKDSKSSKTRDASQDNNTKPAADPATAVNPLAVAAMAPPPPQAAPAPQSDQGATAAITDAAKGAAKTGKTDPTSAAGVNNGAADDTAKTNPAGGKSVPSADTAAAAQTGSSAQQTGDAAKGDSTTQTASAGDKASSAPSQAQTQTIQPQASQTQAPQVQAPQTQATQQSQAVVPAPQLPAQPQTGAAASVSQNVQVGPQDPGANANTVAALAVAIAAKSQSGNKQFDIRLDPPELGRVEVRLSIDASGKAQASLSADQPRTLDLLKTDAPALTRALRDAGLNVAQNGLNFSLRGQDRQNANSGSTPRSGRSSRVSLTAVSTIGSVPSGANYQGPADGRLDIRV